jgi:hypothetical protein
MVSGFAVLKIADGLDDFQLKSSEQLAIDGWTHISYTVDTATGYVKLFLNGVLSSEARMLDRMFHEYRVEAKEYLEPIESAHNFVANTSQYWYVAVPGATKYLVSFDSKSSIPEGGGPHSLTHSEVTILLFDMSLFPNSSQKQELVG